MLPRNTRARWGVAGVALALAGPRVLGAQDAPAPAKTHLSGYIRHAESRDVVRYASLAINDTVRTQSTADGFYFLTLTPGTHRLRVRAIGFAPLDTAITISAATTTDLLLTARTVQLQTVEVKGDEVVADIDPTAASMSIARLDLATVRQAPAAFGEVDPLRSITLLPGVSRPTDFSTAFSVRGSGPEANLILLDEATIYNAAHVFGFLSVFNPDAVADMTLYKGAIPPRFGGRLSAVLDARQREGNATKFGGTVSLGLLASRLMVEGPLPKTGGSFLLAARRTYADQFLRFSNDSVIRDSRAYFYDLNAKASLPLGKTGTLMGSVYAGRDVFQPTAVRADWGNISGTVRWNQIFATRLFSKASWTMGRYDQDARFPILAATMRFVSFIRSQEFRLEESLHLSGSHVIEFGAEFQRQDIQPAEWLPVDTSALRAIRVPRRHGNALAGYLGHAFDLGSRISVQYGARYSSYARRAPGTTYAYANNRPIVWNPTLVRYEPALPTDSTRVTRGTIVDAGGVEPRASIRIGLGAASSVKASYARTRQYMLQASRTNGNTPLDVWEPIGPWFKPQVGDQYAVGYQASLGDGAWDVSLEGYVKRSTNVLDFIDGVDPSLNPRVENALMQGIGRARGLELFVRRQRGDLTGWVSYTLGKSERRFREGQGIGINGGVWFPSPSDKRHELSAVAMRPVWGRWTLGSTFSASSGLPVTYPVARYILDGFVVPEFGARNSARLPAYHRLDLSLTRKGARTELQFGVFNAYNRFNAQSMFFRQTRKDPLRSEAVQLSIFGIVPSISYTFSF